MKRFIAALVLAATFACPGASATADETRSGPLYDKVAALDRALFDAYNRRDLDDLMARFSDDLEFWHDKDGLSGATETRQGLGEIFKRQETTRTLVPGSLEVWPLGKDGALARGRHTFCHEEHGKPDCGTFEFVNVWRKTGEEWKLARVISFGH